MRVCHGGNRKVSVVRVNEYPLLVGSFKGRNKSFSSGKRNCPQYWGVRIKRMSVERGVTNKFEAWFDKLKRGQKLPVFRKLLPYLSVYDR